MKRLLASYHLTGAAHNTRIAGQIEEEYEGDNSELYRGERFARWQQIHNSHVIMSFISSFAAIEATINEFWDELPWKAGPNRRRLRWCQSQFFEENDNGNFSTLEKYELALECAGAEPFDKGKEPYQSVELLRRTRNFLVHYEPEWIDRDREDRHKIAQGLYSNNIALNPFENVQDEDDGIAPFDYFSYDAGVWAVKSAIEFIDTFFQKLGTVSRFWALDEVILEEIEIDWEDTDPAFK